MHYLKVSFKNINQLSGQIEFKLKKKLFNFYISFNESSTTEKNKNKKKL